MIQGQGHGPVVTLRNCHDPNTLLEGLILAGGDGSLTGGIDAGDPNAPYELEPGPNGNRANQGAYGDTPQAAGTPVD